jgi:acyl carrier protein
VDANRIRTVVTEFVEELPDTDGKVSTSASFEELGVDSMSTMDLVLLVEKEFGIEVPDEKLQTIVNIDDLVNYVASAAQEVNR